MNNSIDYASLGAKIKAERKKLGYTQEKLAEMCEISTGFLGHIEGGTRKLSLETLFKISNVLNTSIDYLLLDSPQAGANFATHINASISNKSPELTKRFYNTVKILAEHIDEL